MKISQIDIYDYALPLTQTINVAGTWITQREGCIVALKDDLDNTGYGDISPLPGLDNVPLDVCKKELLQAKHQLEHQPLHYDHFNPTSRMLGMVHPDTPVNRHVLFGLESALMRLVLQHDPDMAATVYTGFNKGSTCVNINGLFVPDPSDSAVQSRLDHLQQAGFSTIKIKIGRLAIQDEIKQIQRLWNDFNHNVTLRLDANQALSFDTYEHYYNALQSIPVEYVEEPLKNSDFSAAAELPWPLAIDESIDFFLDNATLTLSSIPKGVTTLIVKPSSFSGLSSLLAFMQKPEHGAFNLVLSSAFNTGLTVSLLGCLASHPACTKTAHGLDTLKYLKQDVITDSPIIQNGCLNITENHCSGRVMLNRSCLRKVT